MKPKQFLKELRSKGVEIRNGTNHYKLTYKGRMTTMLRHPAKEMSNVLVKNILKQLGIK